MILCNSFVPLGPRKENHNCEWGKNKEMGIVSPIFTAQFLFFLDFHGLVATDKSPNSGFHNFNFLTAQLTHIGFSLFCHDCLLLQKLSRDLSGLRD